tara:strand:+ start:245 stop:481 length:237 start_codon:yes stop_codon:yes gene_type:complete
MYQPERTNQMKAYYTLCRFDAVNGQWFDEFGDFSKADVDAEWLGERHNGTPAKHLKIVKTNGTLADLIAKRDALALPL